MSAAPGAGPHDTALFLAPDEARDINAADLAISDGRSQLYYE